MGWKQVKEHYRITHHVQVTPKGICVGSSYIHDLLVISREGVLVKRYEDGSNADLQRYQAEMDKDPGKLRELVLAADTFERAVTVYTYEGSTIIETVCEEPGWPNVTHEGAMMYENTFSTDRAAIVREALANAAAGVSTYSRMLDEQRRTLEEYEHRLKQCQTDLVELQASHDAKGRRKGA